MSVNMRSWNFEGGMYISPRYSDPKSYDRTKKYFIRAQIDIVCDDAAKIIKIPANNETHKLNLEKLKQLKLISS